MQEHGFYFVTRENWYVERAVWLVSGVVALIATGLALWVDPAWVLLVTAAGLASLLVAFSGYCVVGSVLLGLGLPPRLAVDSPAERRWPVYRMRTDTWFLERGIYLVVGTNLTLASLLVLGHSLWWLAFIGFVGTASVAFAATGFCPVANVLYWLDFEPRLGPASAEAGTREAGTPAPARP